MYAMVSLLDQNEARVALFDKRRPVIFAGENHLITLYRSGSDAAMVRTSCWHCTYSDHGEGTVLVMRIDQEATSRHDLPPLAVYADNPALARMITARFNQYFDGFRDLGLAALAPQSAQFIQYPNGRRSHRIVCTSGAQVIELVWEDMFDAALELFYNTSGPIPYDVSAVICPCTRGIVLVNGTPLPGETRVPAGDSASSAFLAFSETWVGTQPESAPTAW